MAMKVHLFNVQKYLEIKNKLEQKMNKLKRTKNDWNETRSVRMFEQ